MTYNHEYGNGVFLFMDDQGHDVATISQNTVFCTDKDGYCTKEEFLERIPRELLSQYRDLFKHLGIL